MFSVIPLLCGHQKNFKGARHALGLSDSRKNERGPRCARHLAVYAQQHVGQSIRERYADR